MELRCGMEPRTAAGDHFLQLAGRASRLVCRFSFLLIAYLLCSGPCLPPAGAARGGQRLIRNEATKGRPRRGSAGAKRGLMPPIREVGCGEIVTCAR